MALVFFRVGFILFAVDAATRAKPGRFRKLTNSLLKRCGGPINRLTDFHLAYKPDFQVELYRLRNFKVLYDEWTRQNPKNDRGDLNRFYFLYLQIESLQARGIEGAFAELGVYRGTTAKLFRELAPERELYLLDTFEGFSDEDVAKEDARGKGSRGNWAASLDGVKSYVGDGPGTHYIKGRFPETAPKIPEHARFALVHLDADLYAPQLEGLRFFYPRTTKGGIIMVHDCNNPFAGSRKALDEFFAGKPETPLFIPDKSGTAAVIKM